MSYIKFNPFEAECLRNSTVGICIKIFTLSSSNYLAKITGKMCTITMGVDTSWSCNCSFHSITEFREILGTIYISDSSAIFLTHSHPASSLLYTLSRCCCGLLVWPEVSRLWHSERAIYRSINIQSLLQWSQIVPPSNFNDLFLF